MIKTAQLHLTVATERYCCRIVFHELRNYVLDPPNAFYFLSFAAVHEMSRRSVTFFLF